MKNYRYVSNNELDTMNFAKLFASKLHSGDIVILSR